MRIRMVQENLGAALQGSSLRNLDEVDAIVADATLDYLPARMATDTVRALTQRLGPRGRLLITAMAPASDEVLWTHLLAWPIITRSPPDLDAILRAAGCVDIEITPVAGSGLMAEACTMRHATGSATPTQE
jgi:hypothetical protein